MLAAALPKIQPVGLTQTKRIQAVKHTSRRNTAVRAEGGSSSKVDVQELLRSASDKFEKIENKESLIVYIGGGLVTFWLSGTLIGAINSVPLLPRLFELVGIIYSFWFIYRYLLFKSNREELVRDVDQLKAKIQGDE